jgi:hypothetical protein
MKLGLLPIGLIPLLVGCSESAMSEVMSGEEATMDAGAEAPASTEEGDYEDGYEPEVEEDLLALMPATTPEYVFVANPDRNTVTRISVPGLAVITTEVGDTPFQCPSPRTTPPPSPTT